MSQRGPGAKPVSGWPSFRHESAEAAGACVGSSGITDTTTVTFHVLGVQRVQGAGRLIGLAIVLLHIDGVDLVLQGVRVERGGSGMGVHAPAFRHPSNGRSVSAVLLPPELRDAIGAEVQAVMGGG